MSQSPHASGDEAQTNLAPSPNRPTSAHSQDIRENAQPSCVTSSGRRSRPSKETPVRLVSVSETMTTLAPDTTSGG